MRGMTGGRGARRRKAPITGCCSALSTSLLPLYITGMQIFKASRSEERESVEMVLGFKSWSSLCESQTVTPPSSPTLSPVSLSVWRSPGSSLHSDKCWICAFSVCFYCVLTGWGAELCFTWNLNPSQIELRVSWPFITIVCSLKATEWVTGTKAVRWAAFHWLACCREPFVPPNF